MKAEEIKQAFAKSVAREQNRLEEGKISEVLGYLAQSVHDLQEAGIDIELLDMQTGAGKQKDNGTLLYTANLRIAQQQYPLDVVLIEIKEGQGRYRLTEFVGFHEGGYITHKAINLLVQQIINRTFNYKEENDQVYKAFMQDLIDVAAAQHVLHKMDDKGVFNVSSVLREHATNRKAAMPQRPAIGGQKNQPSS